MMPVILHETEVIRKPLISEKSTFLATVKNAYSFEVDKSADKPQIKAAIEKLYNVKVLDVRTANVEGKTRRTRTGFKKTREWKKAIVTLHADNKIDLF
jgi:large subunit ribosomal protein L23